MNWAKEQVIRAAYRVYDDLMVEAKCTTNGILHNRAMDLYYRIQEYKARKV